MKDDRLNIICFLWGDWLAPRGPEYVHKLYAGVRRNLNRPFRFILLTDGNQGHDFDRSIEVRELNSPSWLGCLPKFAAFDSNLDLKGRVLVMDLDTVITGSLDDIAGYQGTFATRMAFREPGLSGGDMLGFEAGFAPWIWDWFCSETETVEEYTGGGRERFMYRRHPTIKAVIEFWQKLYPGQYVSYKRHVRGKGIPKNCRLISCHGEPRPHEIEELKEFWK